jgi:cyclophilin family peptidyl-prolyl cis-trans isomerase
MAFAASLSSPPTFSARFATDAGDFVVECHRAWAPIGVDQFYGLLMARHYDDTRVYRMIPGWVAQFGYSGDAMLQRELMRSPIADDPVLPHTHNTAGIISYSAAYDEALTHATNRTSELFVNLADHLELDALGFAPICEVAAGGMQVVRRFYSGYGELADACDLHGFTPCDGPSEAEILSGGNALLDARFPLLTRIHSATLVAPPSAPPPPPPPVATPPGSPGTSGRNRQWTQWEANTKPMGQAALDLIVFVCGIAAVAFGAWLVVEVGRSIRAAGENSYLGGCVCCWLARVLQRAAAGTEDRQRLARRSSADRDGINMARVDEGPALSSTHGELGTYPAAFAVPER